MSKLVSVVVPLLFIVLSACTAPVQKASNEDPDTRILQTSKILQRIQNSSIILIGEKHDNGHHHRVQATLLRQTLNQADTVVFEMLNRKQQPVIDLYLNDKISYAELPEHLAWEKSGWPDWSLYGPLLQAAKSANAKILYGSYPRAELRSKMTEKPEDKTRLPDHLMQDLNEEIRTSHCDLLPNSMIAPMSNIQIAKDRLMAGQLLRQSGPGRSFLIAGNGHVRKDRGVPYYLAQRDPNRSIFVIGLLENNENSARTEAFVRFDSVWTTDSAPEKDYCAGLRKKFGK